MGTVKRERQKANRQLRLEQLQKEQTRAKTKKRAILIVGLLVVFVLGAWILSKVVSGGSDDNVTTATSLAPTPCAAADGSSPKTQTFTAAPANCIDPTKTYTATVETNKGNFTIALDPTKAPVTVNNFVNLARYHYFDDTPCHRIIPSFVVQCGDPTGSGSGDPGYEIPDELPQAGEYKIGSIAMANSGANTGGSQFFIVSGADGVSGLQPNYSLFGQVTDGLDTTVKALDAAGNPDPNANGTPTKEPVTITKVTITES